MANYKGNKKKSGAEKIAKAICALFLVAIMLGGGIVLGYGSATDWKYKRVTETKKEQSDDKKPGNEQDKDDNKDNGSKDKVGDIVVTGDGEQTGPLSLSVKRMTDAPSAEGENHTVYQVTAVLTPANTTDVVDMSIVWARENSADISEYMKLDHKDGALTATLTSLKPFSTTINLTATVRGRDISKTVKLDYLKKIGNYIEHKEGTNLGDYVTIDFNGSCFSAGSIYPSKLALNCEIKINNSVESKLTEKGLKVKSTINHTTLENNSEDNLDYEFGDWQPYVLSLELFNDGNDETVFRNAFYDAIEDEGDFILVTITITYYTKMQGQDIVAGSFIGSFDTEISRTSLAIPATSMEFSDDLVFWN